MKLTFVLKLRNVYSYFFTQESAFILISQLVIPAKKIKHLIVIVEYLPSSSIQPGMYLHLLR